MSKLLNRQVTIKIHEAFSDDLKSVWLDLESAHNVPVFQSLEWCSIWWKAQQRNQKLSLHVVVFYDERDPVLLLPLILESKLGISVLQPIGFPFCDYFFPPQNTQRLTRDCMKSIWRQFVKNLHNVDALHITRIIPEFEGASNSLRFIQKGQLTGFVSCIDISKKVKEATPIISKKQLKQNRWAMRKLQQYGEIEIETVSSKSKFLHIFNFLIEQKSDQMVRTGATNYFSNQINQRFLIELFQSWGKTGKVDFAYLKVGGEILAIHFGVNSNRRYYYLIPSYSVSWAAKYSPGMILLLSILTRVSENVVDVFDFTIGTERYKDRLADKICPVYDQFHGLSVRGKFFVFAFKAVMLIKTSKRLRNPLMKIRSSFRIIRGNLF